MNAVNPCSGSVRWDDSLVRAACTWLGWLGCAQRAPGEPALAVRGAAPPGDPGSRLLSAPPRWMGAVPRAAPTCAAAEARVAFCRASGPFRVLSSVISFVFVVRSVETEVWPGLGLFMLRVNASQGKKCITFRAWGNICSSDTEITVDSSGGKKKGKKKQPQNVPFLHFGQRSAQSFINSMVPCFVVV